MAQVRNLRPGRRYAYRIVIKPDVVPPWADPPEQPPSAAEIYETPATVPMPPKPIKCTRRERAAFEVCVPSVPSTLRAAWRCARCCAAQVTTCSKEGEGVDVWLQLQLRWFEPGETGGRPIQEYTAQMRPPPADAAGQHPNLEVGGPKICNTKHSVAKGHLQPFCYIPDILQTERAALKPVTCIGGEVMRYLAIRPICVHGTCRALWKSTGAGENRHRQKNLAHATEYEFRLKASPSSTLRILIAQNSLKQSRGAYLLLSLVLISHHAKSR